MSPDQRRRRVLLRAIAGVAAVVLAAQSAEVFEDAELPTVDARFRLRGTQDPPADLLVVGVDDVTLQQVDAPWPFPLDVHARVVEVLALAGADVVVLDLPIGPSDPAATTAFGAALDAAPAVTLATLQTTADGDPVVLGGPDALTVDGVRAAEGRLDPDDDGVVRRFDHTLPDEDDSDDEDVAEQVIGSGLPSVPVVAVEQATGQQVPPDVTGSEGATIDVPGPTGTIPQVSYVSVLEGDVAASEIAGRIVVVGATSPGLGDVLATPLAERTSRAEVQAAAIGTLLADLPVRTPSRPLRLLLTLLACLAPLAAVRLDAGRGVVLVVGLALAWLGVAQVAFGAGVLLPVVAPITGLVGAALAAVGVNYASEVRARRRVREVFGRYVPPSVVREVVEADPDGDLLRATTREVTVLFSDLRGFTTFSEGRPPEQVVRILNAYLGDVTDVLVAHGAQVDYLGDGVMAVFGAPVPQEDHADRALAAAVGVLEATRRFDEQSADLLDGSHFRVGIGLNSGTVTAGNLGTVQRLKYTVIGDAVNTAARIEGMTKDAPYDLLVADATRALLADPPDDLVEHATLPVRGRSEPVRLWSLARAASGAVAGTDG